MKGTRNESFRRLQHILEAINRIQEYSAEESCESFCQSNKVHDAILYQFMVIGEAIMNVEEDKLNKHNYPWHKVRSFRNLIAHEYFNIKLTAVWGIIEYDLPVLKEVILNILKNEF